MKVYVVYHQEPWEEPDTIGVYVNEDMAIKEANKVKHRFYLEFDLIE